MAFLTPSTIFTVIILLVTCTYTFTRHHEPLSLRSSLPTHVTDFNELPVRYHRQSHAAFKRDRTINIKKSLIIAKEVICHSQTNMLSTFQIIVYATHLHVFLRRGLASQASCIVYTHKITITLCKAGILIHGMVLCYFVSLITHLSVTLPL